MTCTPLIVAVDYKHQSCVQCLLAAGADPNIPNELGETPLYRGTPNKGILKSWSILHPQPMICTYLSLNKPILSSL